MSPLPPWRKRFWTLIAFAFCPIATYALRARARACGCDGCLGLVAGPQLVAAIRRAQESLTGRIDEYAAPRRAN